MSTFERITKYVKPRVPGAPNPLIEDAIRDSAIEFSKRTRIWRYTHTIASTVGNDQTLLVDADTDVFEIESARFDSRSIDPISVPSLDGDSPGWRDLDADTPIYYTQIEPNTIRLVPVASTAAELKMGLLMAPSSTATTIPDWMVEKHYKAIAYGAIGELSEIPEQPFFNETLSIYYQGKFEGAIEKLTKQTIKGQQRARPKTKSSWF